MSKDLLPAEEATAGEAAPEAVQEIFHLDLHAWVETQQTSHGVRHDDFAQYRAYCTRRLFRLSHLPEAKKFLVASNNPKYATTGSRTTTTTITATVKNTTSTGNRRHAFRSRYTDTLSAEETHVPHVNVLWYLLVLSERSWAHANELLSHSKNLQPKNRQPVLKKLKRATEWANRLLQKSQLACDASTIQECQAYASWMAANYALEQFDYSTASQEYAKAMTFCHQLSLYEDPSTTTATLKNTSLLERQDLFVTRADTVLRPLFRYCQYELKQSGQPLVVTEEPRRLLPVAHSAAAAAPKVEDEAAIVFRGKELLLESKELRVLLLKLQSLLVVGVAKKNSKNTSVEEEAKHQEEDSAHNETAFLNTLSVLDDALEVVQLQLNTLEQKALTAGPAIKAKRQQYMLWKGYLQWVKTVQVMDHTSNLLRNLSGHAERVHVYDALLQHAKTLLHLPRPGEKDNANEQQEEDDEFALQAQANILRLRALKTYHMAWYYYQELRNCQAAWTLLEHSTDLCKRAKEEIAACDEDMPYSEEYLTELDALPMESLRAAIRAALYLQGTSRSSSKDVGNNARSHCATHRPLMLRLPDPDPGTVLAGELHPMPMPCKPVFYDLAWFYAVDTSESVDPIQAYVDEHTVPSQPEQEPGTTTSSGKGFLGWLTG